VTEDLELRIANDHAAMAEVAERVERFGAEQRLPQDVVNAVNVAIDEALSNIIAYGYDQGVRGEIVVRLRRQPRSIHIDIEDQAKPFDPLTAPPPDLTSPLAERKVGGLGIHLIKHLMDEVSYARTKTGNLLKLVKNLAIA
jgi:anti-sigma regulatory factor (Ser/Thr protein kinase)